MTLKYLNTVYREGESQRVTLPIQTDPLNDHKYSYTLKGKRDGGQIVERHQISPGFDNSLFKDMAISVANLVLRCCGKEPIWKNAGDSPRTIVLKHGDHFSLADSSVVEAK